MSRRPPARPPLTSQQRAVLAAIRAALDTTGRAPTFAEIGTAVGIGRSTVHWHISALEAAGYIRRPPHSRRGAIEVCDDEPGDELAARRAATRWRQVEQVEADLRIPVPDDQPASVFTPNDAGEVVCPAGHPWTADSRWFAGGVELCRVCGRAAVADDLAAKAVG